VAWGDRIGKQAGDVGVAQLTPQQFPGLTTIRADCETLALAAQVQPASQPGLRRERQCLDIERLEIERPKIGGAIICQLWPSSVVR